MPTRRRSTLSTQSIQSTLADVARMAGISTASVSRALSRPDLVSDALRSKVTEAAEALHYVPNMSARALASRRSGLIGLVARDLDSSGVAGALAGMSGRLSRSGWMLLLGSVTGDEDVAATVRSLIGRGVEGLILMGVTGSNDSARFAQSAGIPLVHLKSAEELDLTGDPTDADEVRAGALAAGYLSQCGHRHVVFVTDAPSGASASIYRGLRAAREQSLLATLGEVRIGHEPIVESLTRAIADPYPPTAAICVSDAVAVALIGACTICGIDVPGRLSLIGVGDTPLARCVSPSLTSVRMSARCAGVAAADRLMARLGQFTGESRAAKIKLVVRCSVASPAGA